MAGTNTGSLRTHLTHADPYEAIGMTDNDALCMHCIPLCGEALGLALSCIPVLRLCCSFNAASQSPHLPQQLSLPLMQLGSFHSSCCHD